MIEVRLISVPALVELHRHRRDVLLLGFARERARLGERVLFEGLIGDDDPEKLVLLDDVREAERSGLFVDDKRPVRFARAARRGDEWKCQNRDQRKNSLHFFAPAALSSLMMSS